MKKSTKELLMVVYLGVVIGLIIYGCMVSFSSKVQVGSCYTFFDEDPFKPPSPIKVKVLDKQKGFVLFEYQLSQRKNSMKEYLFERVYSVKTECPTPPSEKPQEPLRFPDESLTLTIPKKHTL